MPQVAAKSRDTCVCSAAAQRPRSSARIGVASFTRAMVRILEYLRAFLVHPAEDEPGRGRPSADPPARLRRKGRTQNDRGSHGGPGEEATQGPFSTRLLRLLVPAARVYPAALLECGRRAGARRIDVADMTGSPRCEAMCMPVHKYERIVIMTRSELQCQQ